MRYERNSDVVYRSGFVVAVTTVIALAWVFGIVSFIAAGQEPPIDIVVAALTILPFNTVMALRIRVVLRRDEVVIYDLFKTNSVPYEAIAGVHRTGSRFRGWTLEIRHADGQTVTPLPLFLGGQGPITRWHRSLVNDITGRIKIAR
jgi:hypothetical protein